MKLDELEVRRVESREELRHFQSELAHLLQRAARTWQDTTLLPDDARLAVNLLGDAILSPCCLLLVLLSVQVHWEGFLYGTAALDDDTFLLSTWYIKERYLRASFPLLFGTMEQYCERAGLRHLVFNLNAPPPISNPRYLMFAHRYGIRASLYVDLKAPRKTDDNGEVTDELAAGTCRDTIRFERSLDGSVVSAGHEGTGPSGCAHGVSAEVLRGA